MPTTLPTFVELHERLCTSVSDREHAAYADIDSRRQAIARLTIDRTLAGERMDSGAVHQAGRDIAEQHRQIDAAALELRTLAEERDSITRGTHPDLVAFRSRGAGSAWAGPQAEYAAARDAFQALLTPELQAAAQRLVNATRSMGTGFEPTILAKAVAGERIHMADAI